MNSRQRQARRQRVALEKLKTHRHATLALHAFVILPRIQITRRQLLGFADLFPPVLVKHHAEAEKYEVVGEIASFVEASWVEINSDGRFVDIAFVEYDERAIAKQLDLEILRAISQGQYRQDADAFEGLRKALSEEAHLTLFGQKNPPARLKSEISGLPEGDFYNRICPSNELTVWGDICAAAIKAGRT